MDSMDSGGSMSSREESLSSFAVSPLARIAFEKGEDRGGCPPRPLLLPPPPPPEEEDRPPLEAAAPPARLAPRARDPRPPLLMTRAMFVLRCALKCARVFEARAYSNDDEKNFSHVFDLIDFPEREREEKLS